MLHKPYWVLNICGLRNFILFQAQSDISNNTETAEMLRSKLESSEAQLRSSNSKLSSLQLETEKSSKRVANLEEKISDLSKQLEAGPKY